VGAGLAVPAEAKEIREAIETVLADASYRDAAARLAAEIRGLPPVDEALTRWPRERDTLEACVSG
jgi:UDP:flavonoid glycosyltransferase YjiC (YdhE family)